MKVTISSKDKLDHALAVVEALYGVRLQQVPGGGTAAPAFDLVDADVPELDDQGATKPRHG